MHKKATSMWQFTAMSAFAYGAIGDVHTLVKIDDVFVTENQSDWLNANDDKDLIRKKKQAIDLIRMLAQYFRIHCCS